MFKKRLLFSLIIAIIAFANAPFYKAYSQGSNLIVSGLGREAINRNTPRLENLFREKHTKLGNNIFMRAFLDKGKLELWSKKNNGQYIFIRNYKFCNPTSRVRLRPVTGVYYLKNEALQAIVNNGPALKSSYPNTYDIEQKMPKRTMYIAPNCSNSFGIGLTDPEMGELYTISYFSAANGQNAIPLHIYPFEMNWVNMFTHRNDKNIQKYQKLAPIYNYFENNNRLPNVTINKNGYYIRK